jgi:fatty-acyl-CoA synthase
LGAEATPTENRLPLRPADFSNLAEALDYAAAGVTGCNFYNGRGAIDTVLPYEQLREEALGLAHRLLGLGVERGARVALAAETDPDFLRFFFACQYAGLVPVPLPVPITLGSHKAYVSQLKTMLASCRPSIAAAPGSIVPLLNEAADGLELAFSGSSESFLALPEKKAALKPLQHSELAYLQYTSGSTRFPRGVMISQETLLHNLRGIIQHGLKVRRGDRCLSWLPFYHDMGLVGQVLGSVASQLSIDYLGPREFAMRPRQWLALMSRNRGTISFGPPFGYELCERRLRQGEAEQFDLSAWRVAGVGAEMIHPDSLHRFAQALAPAGFDRKAFLACYGMAECSLAVSFAPLSEGLSVDHVDADHLAESGRALPAKALSDNNHATRRRSFVDCGSPLPDFEIEIRDKQGCVLDERHSGTIFLRGDSVMSGYFGDPDSTRAVLSPDGWLNTGDIGYRIGERLVVSGRSKDLIIINGRNIWPQDLEHLAEQQPEIRSGDALAFAAPGLDEIDIAVMVVQCRETDEQKRADLIERIRRRVYAELSIDCHIELAPLHTLPRTSSGKLSRSKARDNFIASRTQLPVDSQQIAVMAQQQAV